MAIDYVEQVASSIIEQLREGTAPWVKPWAPGERFMPYNPTTGNEYRGMNAMWLLSRAESRGHGDARWMTYRQAQEQGGQVRKGEKGTPIQFWKWQGLEPVRDAEGRAVLDQEGNPVRRMVRYERPRVLSAVVFNAQQIDGLPPAPDRPALPEWERHERAERILASSGASLRHVPGDRAFYRLSDDRITLPERGQFPTADRYYATALHELGHWTGHPSRLARDMAHPFGSEGYAREELRAEIASLMLGEQLGIGHDPGQHVAYIESWIEALEKDPREVFRAAADADKIAKMVRSFELEQERPAAPEQVPGFERQAQAVRQDGVDHAPSVAELLTPLQALTAQIETSAAANDGAHLLAQPVNWNDVFADVLGPEWAARAEMRKALQAELSQLAGPDFGRTATVATQDGDVLAFRADNQNDLPTGELRRVVGELRAEQWPARQAARVLDPKMATWLDRYDRRNETPIGRAMNALEERVEAAWDKFLDVVDGVSGHRVPAGDEVGLGSRLVAKIEHAYDRFLDFMAGSPANAGEALAAKAEAEQMTERFGLVARFVESIENTYDKFLNVMSGYGPSGPDLSHWKPEAQAERAVEQQQEAEPTETAEARPPVMIQENHPAMTASSSERTYLAVPYDEKDDAKQLGAKWDRGAKAWYVPAGVDLNAFSAWMPAKGSVHIAVDVDPREQFAEAVREAGLRPSGPIEMDGQMHRVAVEGDRGKERSGAYKGYLDGWPAGYIQNHRTGLKTNWAASSKAAALSVQDRAQMAAEAAQKRHDRALEREQQYERTAQQVDALWAAATPAQAHPYL